MIGAFEMKVLREILRVSWTAKKTNKWVLRLFSKQGSCVEKEIMQETMPGARRRGRPRTAWMDNIKTWTGLPVEDSVRMTGHL